MAAAVVRKARNGFVRPDFARRHQCSPSNGTAAFRSRPVTNRLRFSGPSVGNGLALLTIWDRTSRVAPRIYTYSINVQRELRRNS